MCWSGSCGADQNTHCMSLRYILRTYWLQKASSDWRLLVVDGVSAVEQHDKKNYNLNYNLNCSMERLIERTRFFWTWMVFLIYILVGYCHL